MNRTPNEPKMLYIIRPCCPVSATRHPSKCVDLKWYISYFFVMRGGLSIPWISVTVSQSRTSNELKMLYIIRYNTLHVIQWVLQEIQAHLWIWNDIFSLIFDWKMEKKIINEGMFLLFSVHEHFRKKKERKKLAVCIHRPKQ